MKILLISGSHSRHLFVHKKIIDLGFKTKAIVMNRENIIPSIPKDIQRNP